MKTLVILVFVSVVVARPAEDTHGNQEGEGNGDKEIGNLKHKRPYYYYYQQPCKKGICPWGYQGYGPFGPGVILNQGQVGQGVGYGGEHSGGPGVGQVIGINNGYVIGSDQYHHHCKDWRTSHHCKEGYPIIPIGPGIVLNPGQEYGNGEKTEENSEENGHGGSHESNQGHGNGGGFSGSGFIHGSVSGSFGYGDHHGGGSGNSGSENHHGGGSGNSGSGYHHGSGGSGSGYHHGSGNEAGNYNDSENEGSGSGNHHGSENGNSGSGSGNEGGHNGGQETGHCKRCPPKNQATKSYNTDPLEATNDVGLSESKGLA